MKTDKQLQEDVLAELDWESSVVDADPILTPGLVFGWRQHGGATQSLTVMQRSAAQALQAGQAQLQAAEFSLAEGNGAVIELAARDSIHGRTQTFEISASGLDSQNVEIDE